MRKLKVHFLDWFDNILYGSSKDNVFLNILKENYDVSLDTKNPDVLFYSLNYNAHLSYKNCIKIFCTSEPGFWNPDKVSKAYSVNERSRICVEDSDYLITSYNIVDSRHFRLPAYISWLYHHIYVTGGAGYKGVKLASKLLEKNHNITILDNFMYGYTSIFGILNHKNINILKMDIRNVKEEQIKKFDVIYHLAGISGMPACATNPHSAEMINTIATKNLVNLLSKNQILINASTTSIYADNSEVCNENSIIKPGSIYSKTKYEAEKIVQERENSISLRFATVFGVAPRMRDDLIVNDFVYRAIHDRSIVIFEGTSKRVAIHIDDAINAYMFALDNIEIMKNEVFNVGDESLNFSKTDVANVIKKYINFEIIDSTLSDLDIRNFVVSFQKIKNIGYKTTKNLEDGIEELIKLYSFYVKYSPYKII